MADLAHNPELLRDALFRRCKRFWAAGLIANFLVFVLGGIVIFSPACGKWVALMALGLKVAAEGLLWYSDHWKGLGQALHRKLDLENAFGWPVTKTELVDFFARYTGSLGALCGDRKGSYFASTEAAGPKRAVQNVRESSWWSMHLSLSMAWVSTLLIGGLFVGCALLLNVSIQSLPAATSGVTADHQTIEVISGEIVKIVTSMMLLVFTFGLLRLACGYFTYSAKSGEVRKAAEGMLGANSIDEVQVIKLWQDYHLARAAAPILPTWIWAIREKKLNALWLLYMHE